MTQRFSTLVSLAASVALLAVAAHGQELNPVLRQPAAAGDGARVLVKLREAGSTARAQVQAQAATDKVAALAARTGVAIRESHPLAAAWHVLTLDPNQSAADQVARLAADAAVAYVEVDHRRFAHAVPNDPLYNGQWYLQGSPTTPSAVNAEQAWSTTTGSDGVVIALLDTGVRYEHPDLGRADAGGRLLPGYDFVTDTRVSNDGDGRDADPSDPGDFLTSADLATDFFMDCGDPNRPGQPVSSSWHGTRVAGIIGARTNNATGVAGSTWSPWLLPVRVLGKCGGFDSDIIPAMLWAGGIHVDGVPDNPYPAQIENLSLGSTDACTPAYKDAIAALAAVGVVVVASAGNEGGPVDTPASCQGAVGVAGLRHAGTKVGFSSLGPEVALSAPAGNCVNTTPGSPCVYPINTTVNFGATTPGSNGYTDQLNANLGTSFSAPIVSGVAALMLAVNGNLGVAQMRARLQEGASAPFPVSIDPTVPVCHVPASPTDLQQSECSCTTDTCGAGMVNAPGAVLAAARPIAAVVVPGNVSPGQDVAMSAGGSAAACGRTIVSYSWAGDGLKTPPNQSTAIFTAPSTGSVTATVTVTDDAGRADTATIVLTPASASTQAPAAAGAHACRASVPAPLPVTVIVAPGTATVAAGASQTFTATVANSSNTAVSWSVNGVVGGSSTTGTITTAGVFTAPASVTNALAVTVTATWSGDSTNTGSAQVTVNPPAAQAQSSGGGGGGATGLIELAALAGALGLLRRRRGRAA
ncbi:MAG TPA: S8 family serine peptidase [Gammaproteobacteria bacterium]|nr:S8 family serine peptidase [Gammaproteobacteria bacterium]